MHRLGKELPLEVPPPPPSSRKWWGSVVSPYGSNTMLALHKCSHAEAGVSENVDDFLVQVIHNERSVALQVLYGAIYWLELYPHVAISYMQCY